MGAKGCTHRDAKVSIHVGSPLQSGSSLQTARWLWQARQRAVRKFSADKLARIVRIILQGLPVLTAAGGLSWHNLFLSIPRPSSPSPFFFLFPPLSLSLLFPLLFSFFFLPRSLRAGTSASALARASDGTSRDQILVEQGRRGWKNAAPDGWNNVARGYEIRWKWIVSATRYRDSAINRRL